MTFNPANEVVITITQEDSKTIMDVLLKPENVKQVVVTVENNGDVVKTFDKLPTPTGQEVCFSWKKHF